MTLTEVLYCVDDAGLEGLLTDGHTYEIRRLACQAVEVTGDDGSTFVCAGSRFSREQPR